MKYSNYYINNLGELCITYTYPAKYHSITEFTYKVTGVAKNGAKDLFLTLCR